MDEEKARMFAIGEAWGRALLNEGRITINDYRAFTLGEGTCGPVLANPLEGEYRQGYKDGFRDGAG